MYISNGFWFGLIMATTAYLSIWAYIILGKIWQIEIEKIYVAVGLQLKPLFTIAVKGINLIIGYMPYMATVKYLGFLPEEYEKLNADDKRYALLHQPRYKQLTITGLPYVLQIICVCVAIRLFDTNGGFVDNAVSVFFHLKQIVLAALSSNFDKTTIHLAELHGRPFWLLMLIYYYALYFGFMAVMKPINWLTEQNELFRWLSIILVIAFCYVYWIKIPWTICSMLSISVPRLVLALVQFIISMYLASLANGLLIYLFLRSSSSLVYRDKSMTAVPAGAAKELE